MVAVTNVKETAFELVNRMRATALSMWQRRWLGLAVAWVVALIGIAIVSRYPEKYEATARVYVDTQSVLRPLMTGITVQTDVDRMVGALARTLISRPNVEKVVADQAIGFRIRRPGDSERIVESLLNDIKLNAGGRENLFNLVYRDTDPERARLVVAKMVDLFVSTGRTGNQRDSQEARRVIDEQIVTHEQKLREAESRLKDFKLRNFGFTGASGQDAFARMATIQDELLRVRLELRASQEARDAVRRQLDSEDPLASPLPQPGVAPAPLPEIDQRIDTQRRQLDDLLRRFTEDHPDVLTTRRLLTQLEEQQRREVDDRRRAATQGRPRASNNPVYQQLRLQLAQHESQVASAQARSSELQGRLDQLRQSAFRFPQVEADLAQLNRDYEIIRANYQQLVARREQAAISQEVETSAPLASFRVIEPPHVPPKPVFPGRLALAALVLAAGIAAGMGAALLSAQFAPTVQTLGSLRRASARPVLGSITLQLSPAMARRMQRLNVAFGSASGALLLAYAGWLVWLALGKTPVG